MEEAMNAVNYFSVKLAACSVCTMNGELIQEAMMIFKYWLTLSRQKMILQSGMRWCKKCNQSFRFLPKSETLLLNPINYPMPEDSYNRYLIIKNIE
jgi:hypothetical protein